MSWAAAKAGRALPEIPTIWGFSCLFGLLRGFRPLPSGFRSASTSRGGAPPGKGRVFSPFLGKDMRTEQRRAAGTGLDERASPAFPLPVRGPPAGDGDTGAPRGAPLPGEWAGGFGTQFGHWLPKDGAAAPAWSTTVGDEHRPAPSVVLLPASLCSRATLGPDPATAPGHSPCRTLRGCTSLGTPTLGQPQPGAVPQRDPVPHPPSNAVFSPPRPSFSPRSP